jgi:large subunit ribosomal protein L3
LPDQLGNRPVFLSPQTIKQKTVKFILGKKVGMTQMFDEKGNVVPVTLISAGPCYVLQKKSKETDGYEAAQIGFEKLTKQNAVGKKSMKGKEYRHIRENRVAEEGNVGDEISVAIFQPGDKVKVSGFSKGKGFQGGVKRHGFKGKKSSTHGNRSGGPRSIGSVGRRFPQHVAKGKKMPGRMGFERISVKGLKVMKADAAQNMLVVRGAVPGRTGTLLEIRG